MTTGASFNRENSKQDYLDRLLREERELARAQMADKLRNEIKKNPGESWSGQWFIKLIDEVEKWE